MRYGITGNINKKNIRPVLNSLINYFQNKGINFAVDKNLIKLINKDYKKIAVLIFKKLISDINILISLGGDGTFLNTVRLLGKKQIPVLGLNLGALGFMAEVSPEEIENFISDIENGNYKVIDLCVIQSKSKNGKVLNAINEIVIDKSKSIRVIELEIMYRNEYVVNFLGDGVLISSPTGSTGYSLSAGGPIISPYSKVLLITPICPHTLNFRPIVVPDDGNIIIKVKSKENFRITADGHTSHYFNKTGEFTIKRADYNIKVVKRINKTYFQTLNSKLLWGEDIRNK
ncbi:MAG: NAD(+)/NADH kinase [Ignavibacteria bacterium]|nr:NAD(+)/NADH kinase [Ignavibacteria bacterium]